MKIPPVRYATSTGGTRLAYVVFGQGPNLVVTGHGMFGLEDELGDEMGGAYFEALGTRFRVAYFDPRGVGLSARDAPISVEQDADDCLAIADAAEMRDFALFGSCACSAGAITAAARSQDRVSALICYGAVANGALATPPDLQNAAITSLHAHWAKATRDMTTLWFPSAAGVRLEQFAQAIRRSISAETTEQRIRIGAFGQDLTDVLRSLELPVLVLQRPDRVTPRRAASDLAALAPNSMLVSLAGNDHYQWEGDSAQVLDALTEFLGVEPIGAAPVSSSGFRALLFTDLESSTALTQAVGDAEAQEVLNGHDAAVREALEANGGEEVKHTGDGIFAAFTSAVSAVEAALQIQRELAGAEVRVRVGLNAGEPIAKDDDYFGTAVQLAARVCDRAEPGQVLVSRVVMDLCAGKGFQFEDQGEATLKGFPEPVRLFVVGEGE